MTVSPVTYPSRVSGFRAHRSKNLFQNILNGIGTVLFVWPWRFKWAITMVILITGSFTALAFQDLKIGSFERGSDEVLGLSLGLDLVGGIQLVYQAGDVDFIPTPSQMQGLVANITRRVNGLGVSEPNIQQLGDDRIMIQLPGLEDEEAARKLIGQTAELEIIERICLSYPCGEDNPGSVNDLLTGLTGADMTGAFASTDSVTGQPILLFELNRGAAQQFAEITNRIFQTYVPSTGQGNRLTFVLDRDLLCDAPLLPGCRTLVSAVVTSPILAGNGVISGSFTPEEVRDLAIQIEAGRLPVPITPLSSDFVAASLGADSLDQAIQAGLVGLLLVLFFMVAYYRISGLVAGFSLLFYMALVLAIFKLIPVTLTLAGLAAFILSLGMAVDANILIFERMKEEIRVGRSLQFATQIGFNRAWTSIRDGNVSTLLIAAVLFFFGSSGANSAVTGFAVALAIGVTTSMFTAIVVSKKSLAFAVGTPFKRWPRLFSPEGHKIEHSAEQGA
jgi:preprotein translocase subunit SecD